MKYDAPGMCPTCKYRFEFARGITGSEKPEDGDVTLCFRCGEIMEFKGGEIVRSSNRDPDVLAVQRRIRKSQYSLN